MMLFLYFSPNFFPELFLSVFMYNLEVKNRVDFGERGKIKKIFISGFFFRKMAKKRKKWGDEEKKSLSNFLGGEKSSPNVFFSPNVCPEYLQITRPDFHRKVLLRDRAAFVIMVVVAGPRRYR